MDTSLRDLDDLSALGSTGFEMLCPIIWVAPFGLINVMLLELK